MSKQQSAQREIGGNLETYFTKPSPGGSNRRAKRRAELLIELAHVRRELEFFEAELRRANERQNWLSWAIRDLLECLEAELSPFNVSHWQQLRRKIVRLKGA